MTDSRKGDLVLHVRREYFNQMAAGNKPFEYRMVTDYWRTRLIGRDYNNVIVMAGYPKRDDQEKILTFPWRGFILTRLRHREFGPEMADVFAIRLETD